MLDPMGFLGRLFRGSKHDRAIGASVLVRGPSTGLTSAPDLDVLARRLQARGRKVVREESMLRFSGPSERDVPALVAVLGPLPAMPAPLLEELCDSAWWWDQARAECRGHAAVVAVQVAEGKGEPLLRRRAVSEVAAAVARESDGVGVVWSDAAGLYEASTFCELVESSTGDEPPTPYWVSLRIAAVGRRRVFLSTGLSAFGMREIEIEVPPRDPEGFARVLHDVLRVAVTRDRRLSVGQTVRLSETLGLRVVEVAASSLPGRPDVQKLELIGA